MAVPWGFFELWSSMRSVLKSRLAVIVHRVQTRPTVYRFVVLCWVLLCVIGALVATELLSRRLWRIPWHAQIEQRHMQPYFMSGGYFQIPVPGWHRDEVMMGTGGPETYGYYEKGGMYIYGFDKKVSSIADRGDFLFQERADLANDITRTDVIRVFELGGSVAYGYGASSKEKRWYAVLERALSATLARQVRLIPAAMPGYVSTQERLVLELAVLPRHPDAVIIFDGFNDAIMPSAFGSRPGDPYDQGVLYEEHYASFFGLEKWFAAHSYLYRTLLHRSLEQAVDANQKHILGNPQLLSDYAWSTASVYLDNVRNMLERCKDKGIPCLVFLQPARDLTRRHKGIQQKLDPFTLAAYDQILKGIQRMVPGDSIYDLTSVFNGPGQENWFLDVCHFEDPGHQAVAQVMSPIVLDALREKLHLSSQWDRH